jgi:hypothetical protein
MVLYGSSFINLIFGFRGLTAALAHVDPHCVAGIALPPVDATSLFHCSSGCTRENEGKESARRVNSCGSVWCCDAILVIGCNQVFALAHVGSHCVNSPSPSDASLFYFPSLLLLLRESSTGYSKPNVISKARYEPFGTAYATCTALPEIENTLAWDRRSGDTYPTA